MISSRNVLILFYEPLISGISRHIRYLLKALQDENIKFWLLCSSRGPNLPDYFNDVLPADRITMVPPNRFFSWEGLIETKKIIAQNSIDVVHIHNLQSILWGYGGSILANCRTIIFTPHIDTACAGKSQWFFRLMWRRFNPLTTKLIALSSEQKKWLLHWKIVDEKKICVISNHIDEHELKKEDDSESFPAIAQIKQNDFIITQIGRLDRQKDPFFLLRCAQLVRDKIPSAVFLLVGEGPLRQRLEKTIDKFNLNDTVVLTGYQRNIRQLLEISDVITLSSRWEGLPYVLLEAACFRKVTIATDIPGNHDIINNGENGFLIRDEQEFSRKLIALYQSPELRQRMGEKGYQKNRDLFDISNMAEPLSSIYNDTVQ